MDRWIGRSEQAGRQALELEGVGGALPLLLYMYTYVTDEGC